MGSERQLKAFCKVGKVCVKELNASEPLSFWFQGFDELRVNKLTFGNYCL